MIASEKLLQQALAQQQAGQLADAEATLRRAHQSFPTDVPVLGNLGMLLRQTNRIPEAAECFRRICQLQPSNVQGLLSFGVCLGILQKYPEAAAIFREAARVAPSSAPAHANLANALLEMGELREAEAEIRTAIALDPQAAVAHSNLAAILNEQVRHDEALAAADKAVALQADLPDAYYNRGIALRGLKRMEEAVETLKRAIELRPNYAKALGALAMLLSGFGEGTLAIATIEKALATAPNDATLHNAAGLVLHSQGRIAEAIAHYRRAVELGAMWVAGSNALFAMHDADPSDAQALFEAHVEWAKRFAEPLRNNAEFRFANPPDPERKLRIAYVSPDFRYHSVAHFLRPIIEHHDRKRFEIVCYSGVAVPDGWTVAFRGMNVAWRDISKLGDREVAQQIHADGIDIAIDCSGHTSAHRLLAFARKPAPVQVSFLGYPDTTGLTAMDYRITDAIADPPGQSDRLSVEKLVRLEPVAWCFAAAEDAPLPASKRQRGPIRFGSFTSLPKLTPQWASIWAKILSRVEDSRLLLKTSGTHDPTIRDRILGMFTAHGIAAERIELLQRQKDAAEHLATYQRIDVALDTFPYHGTTTTCEAMYMGIPVVTMAGQIHASRVGASLLSAVGVQELIATDEERFVEIAVALAQNKTKLRNYHAKLREKMRTSSLMDAPRYVAGLELAYREMWKAWTSSQ